jgi:cGMP-dependent protein kinase 2
MSEPVKVAIIGSGPAGLSAASRAAQLGLSHILLEKTDHLSDTIFKYQKGKRVLATPERLDLRSDCRFAEGAREYILGNWDEDAANNKVQVAYHAEVAEVTGQKGAFSIKTAKGDVYTAENIVLAIGTQGNPNRMRCEGADLPHIIYQVDDPEDFKDKHITVVGSGDAGIENALGVAEEALENTVTILNRSKDFARAKAKNVSDMTEAGENGFMSIRTETQPKKVEPGWLTLETPTGEERIECDVIVARLGSVAPRGFVESMGIEFTGPDREAFPKLSPTFETTVPGIYVIGALAGYPLIKHCMNQGYDVVEFLNGNKALTPADEKDLAAIFEKLPQRKSVSEWLEYLRTRIRIFADVSPLQMREFMLDSKVAFYSKGDVVFEKGDPGSSLFAIADGHAVVEVGPDFTVPIEQGSIFGEVGLISGRKRGATIRAGEDSIFVEVSRTAALKLMAAVPGAKRVINRISLERQLLQIFKGGLTVEDLEPIVEDPAIERVPAGKVVLVRGRRGRRCLCHPLGVDGGRKGYRRQTDLPALSARGQLLRRNGGAQRRAAQRHGQGRGRERSDPAEGARIQGNARQAAASARGDRGCGCRTRADEQLHRVPQGQLFERGRSLFGHRDLHHEGRAGRGDRRAADRRKSLRRLRQLREGVRRQP